MSQTVFDIIEATSTSGTELAGILTDFKNAVISGMSGTTRPAQISPGGMWVNTTLGASPDYTWIVNIFDGSDDVEIYRVNIQTNKVSIGGAADQFDISKISPDDDGAIVRLIKSRISTFGQVLDGDTLGEVQFQGTDSTGSKHTQAKISSDATDDFSSARGADLIFSATPEGSGSMSEVARLKDGNLGLGTTSPAAKVHAVGTAILIDHRSDDANPAELSTRKNRVSADGNVANDIIGAVKMESVDSTAATVFTAARVTAVAEENHTSTARGTSLVFEGIKAGATALFAHMKISSIIETISRLEINSLLFRTANVATSATITNLSASKAIINMTGSTATSLRGMVSTSESKVVVIHNRSSAVVTVENEHAGATAADRFLLPGAAAVAIPTNGSAQFFYSTDDSRWKLISISVSSGGGGSGTSPTVTSYLSGSGTFTTGVGVKWLEIFAMGGGGSGATSGNASSTPLVSGNDGGDTTFGTSLITAGGGNGFDVTDEFAIGGGTTVNSPALVVMAVKGEDGGANSYIDQAYGSSVITPAGSGGNSFAGGAGNGGRGGNAGGDASPNSGSGGGGGGSPMSTSSPNYLGGGGAGGGYVHAIIRTPGASYAYSVGARGNGVSGTYPGCSSGHAGGGFLTVIEHY